MPTRELEHIADVLPRVLDEAKQAQERFAYEHPKPRALEAVSKAREASYQVRRPQAPVRLVKRPPRREAGHLAHTRVDCPQCESAARRLSPTRVECDHCDRTSQQDPSGLWMVVGPSSWKWNKQGGKP